MPNTFTDLKQLSRAFLKKSPPPPVDSVPVEKPVVDEGAEVLAYFSRSLQNARESPCCVRGEAVGTARVAVDQRAQSLEAPVRQRQGHAGEDAVRLSGEPEQRKRDREQVLLTMDGHGHEKPGKAPAMLGRR